MSLFKTVDRLGRTARLLVTLGLGAALFFALRAKGLQPATAFLYAWILFSGLILTYSWIIIVHNDPAAVGAVASEEDNGPFVTFLFITGGAVISLFAIIALLQGLPRYSKTGLTHHVLLSVVAVVFSWALIHTLFTLRYAHLWYTYPTPEHKEQEKPCEGLVFPGTERPDMFDFAYFAFVLGTAFQVSDVSVSSRRLRRLVMVHGLLAFAYNTVIVAFAINIVSGIIGK